MLKTSPPQAVRDAAAPAVTPEESDATDKPMQLGMIGLGRMGANLVRRLMADGHRCVVYDVSPMR